MKSANIEMTCEKKHFNSKKIFEGEDVKNNKLPLSSSLRAFLSTGNLIWKI